MLPSWLPPTVVPTSSTYASGHIASTAVARAGSVGFHWSVTCGPETVDCRTVVSGFGEQPDPTATVTSLFVASYQDESHAVDEQRRVASEEETRALLREILERLDRLEKKPEDPLGPSATSA